MWHIRTRNGFLTLVDYFLSNRVGTHLPAIPLNRHPLISGTFGWAYFLAASAEGLRLNSAKPKVSHYSRPKAELVSMARTIPTKL